MTFQAIDTQLIIDTAINSANRAGLNLDIHHYGKGIFKGKFGDTIIDPSGSKIQPMIFLRNINDGGHAFMISVGLFRFVCANGLTIGNDIYSQRIIHREGPTMNDFISNLEVRLNNAFEVAADDFMEQLTSLADKQITNEQGLSIIHSLELPQGVAKYSAHRWVNPTRGEDAPRNLYSLYNVLNEMNRRLSASKVVEFNRELTLLPNIEALYEHEQFLSRIAA